MSMRRCNICLRRSKMSRDHIFPRSITKKVQRRVSDIGRRLGADLTSKHTRIAQNGYTESNICERCNNSLLGASLDPHLTKLYRDVDRELGYLKFIGGGSIIARDVDLKKAIRAVSAHLLAYSKQAHYKAPIARDLRRLVFKGKRSSRLRIGIWLFPYKDQVLLNSVGIASILKGVTPITISAYKTYPLAIAFIFDNPTYTFPFKSVLEISNCFEMPGDIVSLRLMTAPLVDQLWPEAPLDSGMVLMHNESGVHTQPYMNLKPYPY